MLPLSRYAALVAFVALAVAGAGPARAQQCAPGPVVLVDGLGTPEDDLVRLAELAGAAPVTPQLVRRGGAHGVTLCAGAEGFGWIGTHPLILRQAQDERRVGAAQDERRVGAAQDERPRPSPLMVSLSNHERPRFAFALLPVRADAVWNSTYPSGQNDGLLWAGRGFSTLLTLGAVARAGPVTATLAPEVAWQQNAWFSTVPTGQAGNLAFANPWYGAGLDLPQRFGAGPFAKADLGQSSIRLDLAGVAAGLSTENLWLGPGTRNALLLTNEGPGFPHAFLGTSAPVDFGIGGVEALVVWGRLSRSRYVADAGEAMRPWFTALALDWSPRWVPGLSVGLGRAFVEDWASLRRFAFLSVLEPPLKSEVPGGDNPEDNQIASAWFRWAFPESHVELYGEWGRDDFPHSFEGLVRDPSRTAAWVAGFQKVWPAGPRAVRFQAELANLHDVRPVADQPVFYTHGNGLDWTDAGQLLGAGAGPGGDQQWFALDVLGPGGRIGGYLVRTNRNEEAFWKVIGPAGDTSAHDVELAAGVRQVLFAGPAQVAWDLSAAYRWDRDFGKNEPNLRAAVSLVVPVGK